MVFLTIVLASFFVVSCENKAPESKGTFYAWDSNEPGNWIDTKTGADKGEYSLEIAYADSTVTLKVDGSEIHSYALKNGDAPAAKTKIQDIIIQSLNNGSEYTVKWTLPEVNGTAVADTGWAVDRTEPKAFDIADGKISITATDADLDDFYRYQGKKVTPSMDAAESWSVKAKLTIDPSLLDAKNFASSIWLYIVDDSGEGLDYAIIELRSNAK